MHDSNSYRCTPSCTYIFYGHTETYTVEIQDLKQYGILKSDTNNVRITLQWLMLLFVHICYL